MRRILRNNGLTLTLLALFLAIFAGQIVAGHLEDNDERRAHGRAPQSYAGYVTSAPFLEAVMENWESEFLQMGVFVVLTARLFQKGSAASKDPDGAQADEDRAPDPSRPDAPGPVRRGGLALALYRHSLSLALFALFAGSFALHAVGGAGEYNEDQAEHGRREHVTALGYVGTPKFWFESLQNWQSEFLSIAVLVVLTVWLREHGSPESKPVDEAHAATGHG